MHGENATVDRIVACIAADVLHFVYAHVENDFQQQNALVEIFTQKSVSSGNSRCQACNATDHDMPDDVVIAI